MHSRLAGLVAVILIGVQAPAAAAAPQASVVMVTPKGVVAVPPKSPAVRSKEAKPAGPAHVLTAHANFATSGAHAKALTPKAVGTPQPPFTECPAIGNDSSCGVLIQVGASSTDVFSDPSQGPYDGADDTLTGVVNTSGQTVQSIALSSDTPLFGFDGDGICTFTFSGSAGCPFGPTGYEGPNTSFSNVTPDEAGGVVNFTGGLAPGATAYFSLEEALTSTAVFGGGPTSGEQGGPGNPAEHVVVCFIKQPVNCATGDFTHTFDDLDVPGRGVVLDFARTYSSSAAAVNGPLGFGWTDSYNMSLATDAAGNVTISQENGSTVPFVANGSGGYFAPPRVLATLVLNGDGTYTFSRRADNIRYLFSSSGHLLSETDLNGNVTLLSYAGGTGAVISSVTDPSGRKLSLAYSGAHIAQVTDPMGRTMSYTYDGAGNLATATDPAGRVWKFTYDANHLLLTMTDPRGGTVTNTYDGSARVVAQIDAAGLKTTWAYTGDPSSAAGGTTTITDEHGNVTVDTYSNLELTSITEASGTAAAATTTFTYDPATLGRTTVTDPNGHVTTNTFDSDGNLSSSTDPLGNKTTYGYSGFDNLTSKTTPAGETTTLNFDGNDNLLSIVDPTGKTTTYGYGDAAHPGDVTSMTDPDGRVTTLTYDSAGNEASVTVSPAPGVNDTTRTVYDADSERVCQTSPDANAAGVRCPAPGAPRVADTIDWTYDPDREVTSATDAGGHVTTKSYDGNGNVISAADPAGKVTNATYDADNRPVKVTQGANGAAPSSTTSGYDLAPGSGACTASVSGATFCSTVADPNGNITVDYFSGRDQLLEEVRPGGHTTTYSYDLAGNQRTAVDAAGRTATSTYDADNRPTAITYSDGTTPNVTYTYDADGRHLTMADGTGTSSYTYDADSRVTSVTNGASSKVGYAYDGANDLVSVTYPSGKDVLRGYDGANRLTSTTDLAGHVTTFTYDADGNIVATAYPNGDTVGATFDPTDQMLATQAAPTATPTSPLATLTDTRNVDENISQESAGAALSGTTTYTYDPKIQLAAANGTSYTYDLAGNPTGLGAAVSQTFDAADELTGTTTNGATTSYSYDKLGDRTSATPASGASLAYSYDQTSRLTSITETAPPPVVSGISPNSGPAAGGTVVTISGTGFTGATAVDFGSTAGTFHVVSDSSITTTAPSGTGTVDVTVTTSGGTSAKTTADQFTFTTGPQPKVLAVLPPTGPAAGGNIVVVIGANLDNARSVRFGSSPASFTQFFFLPDIILARAPAGSATVDVTVTTPNGTSAPTPGDRYTYRGGPLHLSTPPPSTSPPRVGAGPLTVAPVLTSGATTNLATYSYDGDGLRTTKQSAAGSEAFTWDVAGATPELLVDGSTSFVYGPDGLPIEQIDGTGAVSYFFHDQLGSTRALLGSTGAVVTTFAYSSYGQVTASTGPTKTPLLFAAGYRDPETGLIYLLGQYYDPVTAQFLTPDPLVGLSNSTYGYVGNNPVNGTDPLGLCWGPECWVESGVHVVGNAVNAALPVIHTIASVVTVAASVCAVVTSETIIGGVTCGTIALAGAAVTAGTSDVLYAEGRESTTGLVLDNVSLGFAGIGSLAEIGANAAETYGDAAEALSALRQAEMDAAPWYGKLGPWVASQWWAAKAALWGGIAQGLSDISRILAAISLGPGLCGVGTN